MDYFRFSKYALLEILNKAGFCVLLEGFSGGGDFIFEVARNLGLDRQDFSFTEIFNAYQRWFENLSDGATNLMAIAFKPPSARCP